MKIFKLFKKLFIFSVILLFIFFLLSRGKIYNSSELSYGITFSQKQATSLGLDWQKLYLDIINDLKIKKIRLPAYWNEIEKNKGQYNYSDLDWQINEAKLNNANIILAIGGRLPRWPECHYPDWTNNLAEKEREEEILNYIKKTIERYKDYENIIAWQIENEPFLNHFGDCPKLDKNLLDKEILTAKNLDNRPILITDSGELSIWIPAAKRGDWFGTTMYRDTYSGNLKRYIHYPIAPGFFRFKKNIARIFSNPEKWLVIELQAEPWGPLPYQDLSEAERSKTMNLQKFKEMIDFSSQTGFDEFYLWGVEWWAWEKEKNNNPALWEEAKKLF